MPDFSIVIRRKYFGDNYILGDLFLNGHWIGMTLEYPWRDNSGWNARKSVAANYVGVSCLRDGVYTAYVRTDAGFLAEASPNPARSGRLRIELEGTWPRTAIQIHGGSTLVQHSQGCILVGDSASFDGAEARLLPGHHVLRKLHGALFGGATNATAWAKAGGGQRVTVRIEGMPPTSYRGQRIVV